LKEQLAIRPGSVRELYEKSKELLDITPQCSIQSFFPDLFGEDPSNKKSPQIDSNLTETLSQSFLFITMNELIEKVFFFFFFFFFCLFNSIS